MILADTSVWTEHLRHKDNALGGLLTQNRVCMHEMVIGELACGNLRNRDQLPQLWRNLPGIPRASHEEALIFLSRNRLAGKGIGYIDVHLLASVALEPGTTLWTRDKRLANVADALELGTATG